METSRLEAFSDGVFAIAITLLVLEIGIPDPEGTESLREALLGLWPSYVAYAISFLTIGIIWVNHHAVFRHIARADRTLLFLNVFFLMCVAFIPFPTGLLAEWIGESGERTAAVAYGVSLTVMAIAFSALWYYAALGRRLISRDADQREVSGISRGPFIYGASTPVALASAEVSVALYGLIALFYVLSSSLWGRDDEAAAA